MNYFGLFIFIFRVGAIVGGVIGGIFALVVIIVVVAICCKYANAKPKQTVIIKPTKTKTVLTSKLIEQ